MEETVDEEREVARQMLQEVEQLAQQVPHVFRMGVYACMHVRNLCTETCAPA